MISKKRVVLAFVSAVFTSSSAVAATSTQSSFISTDFVQSITLGGNAFTTPNSPTSTELNTSSQVSIGPMSVSSNTPNCSVSIDTTNSFRLQNGASVLATFELGVRRNTSHTYGSVGKWDSATSGNPVTTACSHIGHLDFLRRNTDTYDTTVPSGTYSDTIHVTVANQ